MLLQTDLPEYLRKRRKKNTIKVLNLKKTLAHLCIELSKLKVHQLLRVSLVSCKFKSTTMHTIFFLNHCQHKATRKIFFACQMF